MSLKQHSLSAVFPAMSDDEFRALGKSIKANGLRHPITLYKGQILDGWHRYQACEKAGVPYRTIDYNGDDPQTYVKDQNWNRRHMNASQRALTEVQISEWAPPGNQAKGEPGAPLATVSEMAAGADVSERTIQQAKVVEKKGSEELKEAVKSGAVSVKTAAKATKQPKAKQAAAAKEKPKKPKPEPVEDHGDSLTKELEAADKTIRSQQALIESLQKSDLAKEVTAWHLKFDKLEGRLGQAVTTKNEAERQARYSTGLLEKIRKSLKVQKNSEILEAIADLKR